jgi:hypothetical protein
LRCSVDSRPDSNRSPGRKARERRARTLQHGLFEALDVDLDEIDAVQIGRDAKNESSAWSRR